MANHIVLYQPEIPANTGNIARTCWATDSELHLIRPLGFSTEDRMLKRAGIDYWHNVTIHYYDSIEDVFNTFPDGEFYYIENFGTERYTDFDFSDAGKDTLFVFGRESDGLPRELIQGLEDRCLRIPMTDRVRSLNLANSASIIIFEALRQQGFKELS
ncbi:tRNA (cytidine(34)-2'-O)-methyltransferase [Thalassobacillus sp. CUG 92003]|uniref:tRNA (cytidine(34)-2'-O)-methyltransferase n=1 Tax=Thalassobacillus sp. CUG 92003 TaxID=2736641 RepID=UPI0015E75D9C|nr:tRNA (cytidine(34)-2'-O)-methyltransferase [Thalassobacillus sp. CUG 92003]